MESNEINSLRMRLADLILVREGLRGEEIERFLENLEISYQFLEENYEELIEANEQYMADYSIEQPSNTLKLERFLVHFQKLLFNYIASFISFVYHMDIFVKEMKDQQFEREFAELKEERHIMEKVQFFEDLRKYMHYYKLPFPRVDSDYVPTSEGVMTDTIPGFCKGELSLRKKGLLKWNGFSKISKVFLRGYLGSVIVTVSYAKLGLVDECQTVAKEMHDWLNIKVDKTFGKDIEEFRKLQNLIEKISVSLQLKWKKKF